MTHFPFDLLPSPLLAFGVAFGGVVWAAGVGWLGGWLKLRRGVATNYTRKIFHFCIFTVAMGVHLAGGFPAVNAYAVGCAAVILYGVWRGAGNPIFEGMARERDEPHRAFYVVIPLLTTALGGLASNLVSGGFALVGYLVTGWGDAVGEPIGRWLGRHPYRVPTLRRVLCTRTLEGSGAVGVASFLAAGVALVAGFDLGVGEAAWRAGVIAVATIGIEAVSPHGSDNFTTMVGASVLAGMLQ